MRQKAPRLDRIKPSPSMVLSAKAATMRASGLDVFDLSIGEPDFATPHHIIHAALDAMKRGETRYTTVDGTTALKKAIAAKFLRDNGLNFSASEIAAASGAKQIIFNAMMASVTPGDEVIIPAPYWTSYLDIVAFAEGIPVVVSCSQDTGFKLGAQALESAITAKTRWLILNAPSNPTGALYDQAELEHLALVLHRNPHVLVMCDDIYEHIRFDNRTFYSLLQVDPTLRPRTLTINGVSKAYSMTGWRIGYAAGPEWLIRAMATLQSQSTSNPCSISQAAAIAALNGPQDLLAVRALEFQKRRDRALSLLRAIPELDCSIPAGAFYLFPNCARAIGKRRKTGLSISNDEDLSSYLLQEAKVAVVPGSAYGLSPHLRLSMATSMDTLAAAIVRIGEAMTALI